MRRFSDLAKCAAPPPGGGFLVRWRGKQEGPHSVETIDSLLETHQIGLLHEINHQGEWLTIRDFMAGAEAAFRQQMEAEETRRQEQEESERETRNQEARQAEQKRKAAEAGAEANRQRPLAAAPPIIQPVSSRSSSSLRTSGILLLLGGLVVTAYFFFGYDTSVESGVGRVNNIGLMADRQNGILIGLGLAIVGTIMLVIGSRD